MDKSFRQSLYSGEANLVFLAGQVTHPAGGVPSADTIPFVSASKQATGTYRLYFEQSCIALRHVDLQLWNTGSQSLHAKVSGSFATTATGTGVRGVDYFIVTGSSGLPVDPSNPVTVSAFLVCQSTTAK